MRSTEAKVNDVGLGVVTERAGPCGLGPALIANRAGAVYQVVERTIEGCILEHESKTGWLDWAGLVVSLKPGWGS